MVALAIRILIEQRHSVPPRSQLPHLLVDVTRQETPILYIALKASKNQQYAEKLVDRWGKPFVIRLSQAKISVSSVNASYVATEKFD